MSDDKRVEAYETLVEQVIFLTRRVHELEERVGVPGGVVEAHRKGVGKPLFFRKEIN